MAPSTVADSASPTQLRPLVRGIVAGRTADDLSPVTGLLAGVAAAAMLWAMPVAAWLMLR